MEAPDVGLLLRGSRRALLRWAFCEAFKLEVADILSELYAVDVEFMWFEAYSVSGQCEETM